MILSDRTPWRSLAACRGEDPAIFYPVDAAGLAEPQAICAGCPVQVDCLEHAIRNGERQGVWGGRSERERDRIARRLRITPRPPRNPLADLFPEEDTDA